MSFYLLDEWKSKEEIGKAKKDKQGKEADHYEFY